jgi:hypothetical protein
MKLNKRVKKFVGSLVLFSQVFSLLAPTLSFAAPQSVASTDIQNSLETVGTKANRLKTMGSSGVDESTGAFTYTYPFSLPKGLMGLEPSISLSYNSQATENSPIGYGWNMAIPYIERSAKQGVDKIYSKNDFVSSLGGELILKTNTTNQYIQKIDDGSYQLYTLNNNIWTLNDRSGNTYTFGTALDSRLCDDACNKIQKYYLTEVRDILGNKIKYFYEKKNNFVYPKEIIYTIKKDGTYSNKIVFEREDRNDKEISYKSQFRVEMSDRIKTIRAYNSNFDNNFVEVAKLELSYTTGQNSTRSLLQTIRESRLGTDNTWSTIPETKFEYEKGTNLSFQSGSTIQNGYATFDITGDGKSDNVSLTEGLQTGALWTFVDYNADYFTDKYSYIKGGPCQGYCTPTLDTGVVKKNESGVTFSNLPISSFNFPYNSSYNLFYQVIPGDVNTVDVNSDGIQDFIVDNSIKLNNGQSLTNASFTYPVSASFSGDFNGDGLVDVIKDYSSSTASTTNGKYVFLNTGNGWSDVPELKMKVDLPSKIKTANNLDQEIPLQYIDINADGLTDVVLSWTSNQTRNSCEIVYGVPVDYIPPGSNTIVLFNNGNGFTKVSNLNIGPNYAVNYEAGNTIYTDKGIGQWCNWYDRKTTSKVFDDSNYDGSVDFGGGGRGQ